MSEALPKLIFWIGIGQLCVPIASLIVPARLNWRAEFQKLSRLHRQLYWTYGGYTLMSIITLGLICTFNAEELAAGSGLARAFCTYGAVFWGVRLSLQAVLDVRPHLTAWWLTLGYHTLTVLFLTFTVVYIIGALHAVS